MVIFVEERLIRRDSLAKGFSNCVYSFENSNTIVTIPMENNELGTMPSGKEKQLKECMISKFYALKHLLEN